MSSDSDRELSIFTATVHLLPHKRAEVLDRLCSGDEILRTNVEALLKAHDHVGDFLEEPPNRASSE